MEELKSKTLGTFVKALYEQMSSEGRNALADTEALPNDRFGQNRLSEALTDYLSTAEPKHPLTI